MINNKMVITQCKQIQNGEKVRYRVVVLGTLSTRTALMAMVWIQENYWKHHSSKWDFLSWSFLVVVVKKWSSSSCKYNNKATVYSFFIYVHTTRHEVELNTLSWVAHQVHFALTKLQVNFKRSNWILVFSSQQIQLCLWYLGKIMNPSGFKTVHEPLAIKTTPDN